VTFVVMGEILVAPAFDFKPRLTTRNELRGKFR